MQGNSEESGAEGAVPTRKGRVYGWALLIALGGLLFGFDTGVISGALLFIKHDFALDSFAQGTVVSILLIGAMIGALSAGRLADRTGRRRALVFEGVVFAFGTLIAAAAVDYWMLLAGRLVLGLAIGGASATVPIYLSELSPDAIRGRTLSFNQLFITGGILIAYLVNLVFAGAGDWRAMFAVGLVPAAVLIAGALWVLPESPSWLLAQGRADEARRVVRRVTGDKQADELVDSIQRATEESGGHLGDEDEGGWRHLARKQVRPALVVGLVLAAIQQFGGINTIIYYAPSVIEKTGLSASNSIFYSVFIGLINLLMTVVALRLVDRVGRRFLLIASLGGMTVTMALLGLSFVIGLSPELSLLFMVAYIAVYAGGLGPIFWVLIGEVFPPTVRAAGSSAATAVNWASNFVVGLLFLPVAGVIGQGETFWIFGVICLAGLFFVLRYVPETRGESPDEVARGLQQRFADRKG